MTAAVWKKSIDSTLKQLKSFLWRRPGSVRPWNVACSVWKDQFAYSSAAWCCLCFPLWVASYDIKVITKAMRIPCQQTLSCVVKDEFNLCWGLCILFLSSKNKIHVPRCAHVGVIKTCVWGKAGGWKESAAACITASQDDTPGMDHEGET